MTKLTHVCMWDQNIKGWRRIDAEMVNANSSISPYSRLFMCDLCGQYVAYISPKKNADHFKHESNNIISQQCPDYTYGNGTYEPCPFKPEQYYLPIRIKINADNNDFDLELGLPPLPKDVLIKNRLFKVLVYSKADNYDYRKGSVEVCIDEDVDKLNSYEYLSWRLSSVSITYLSVGSDPSDKYYLKILPMDHPLSELLPKRVEGISSVAIFDAITHKRVPKDCYIKTNNEYIMISTLGVNFPKECYNRYEFRAKSSKWYVYRFKINELSERVARFFVRYGFRLDESAVLLQSIWPICVRAPHVLLHKIEGELYFFMRGNAGIKSFPNISDNSSLYKINNLNNSWVFCCVPTRRNQLIASGRLRVLKYEYIWEDELAMEGALPEFSVKTLDGEAIESGTINALPRKGKIVVSLEVDGFVERRSENVVVGKYLVKAKGENDIEVRDGDCIQIYVGLDKVWECTFVRKKTQTSAGDEALYQELVRCRGSEIAIPHAFGALAGKLKGYPKTMQWLRRCIREGKAVGRALLILERWLRREEDENS